MAIEDNTHPFCANFDFIESRLQHIDKVIARSKGWTWLKHRLGWSAEAREKRMLTWEKRAIEQIEKIMLDQLTKKDSPIGDIEQKADSLLKRQISFHQEKDSQEKILQFSLDSSSTDTSSIRSSSPQTVQSRQRVIHANDSKKAFQKALQEQISSLSKQLLTPEQTHEDIWSKQRKEVLNNSPFESYRNDPGFIRVAKRMLRLTGISDPRRFVTSYQELRQELLKVHTRLAKKGEVLESDALMKLYAEMFFAARDAGLLAYRVQTQLSNVASMIQKQLSMLNGEKEKQYAQTLLFIQTVQHFSELLLQNKK